MTDVILQKFGDYGAESSRRDRFQMDYATYWCIEMLVNSDISEVISEWGEDVVLNRNGVYELHQVKTRQESMDDWTVKDFIPIVGKTFAMVPYFPRVSKCRFVSNKGADGVIYKLKTVLIKNPAEWSPDDHKIFDEFCTNHSRQILSRMRGVDGENSETVSDVEQRLLLLEINTDFCHMDHLQDLNLTRLRQVLESNTGGPTYTHAELEEAYERIVGLVGDATIGKTREEKTLTRERVRKCLEVPMKRGLLYRFPNEQEIRDAPGKTRMEQKLNLGGFNPAFIESARELMVASIQKARGWQFGDVQSLLEDVRFRMKYLWADSYDKVCQANLDQEQVGRLVLEEIKRDLPGLVAHYRDCEITIDEFFLLGTVWTLTSECKAYWNQRRVETS